MQSSRRHLSAPPPLGFRILGGAFICASSVVLLSFIATGATGWTAGGTPVSVLAGRQFAPTIASDGLGGAFIVWQDTRSLATRAHDVYSARLGTAGGLYPAWPANGDSLSATSHTEYMPHAIPDGLGGMIAVWSVDLLDTQDQEVALQRLSSAGARIWSPAVACAIARGRPSDFVVLTTFCTDGNGGAIVAWSDYRNASTGGDIYAQHVAANGTVTWTTNGNLVCGAAGEQTEPMIAPDGTGGAIVVWVDHRADTSDIYAQRISVEGDTVWTAGAVPISNLAGDQQSPTIFPDGSGGAFVAWADADIHAQRIAADGTPQWAANGVDVCTAANVQSTPQLISDGGSGAIIAWDDLRSIATSGHDIYTQRLGSDGTAVWAFNGVPVVTEPGDQTPFKMIPDGTGGCLFAFAQGDIYGQRISSVGTRPSPWPAAGVVLCNAQGVQETPVLCPDGSGGAIVAWADLRDSATNDDDIYATRVDANGHVAGALAVDAQQIAYLSLTIEPNPAVASVRFRARLGQASAFKLEIVDVSGRRVRTLQDTERLSAGDHTIVWDGLDAEGRKPAPGVYMAVWGVDGERSCRRLVVLR